MALGKLPDGPVDLQTSAARALAAEAALGVCRGRGRRRFSPSGRFDPIGVMPTFKITLAYDGTDFAGWQLQPGQRTVQGVLEVVLRQLTGRSVRVLGASRTDTGVHALGQVAVFTLPTELTPDQLQRALNALLPPDVVVRAVEEVPGPLRPSRDATAKRYRYLLYDGRVRTVFLRRYVWQIDQRLDVSAMHQAAQCLVGTHDFASFQSRGSPRLDTVRTLFEVSVQRCRAGQGGGQEVVGLAGQVQQPAGTQQDRAGQGGEGLESIREAAGSAEERGGQGGGQNFPLPTVPADVSWILDPSDSQGNVIAVEVEGDGFLYHMVRAIVGTLVEVGRKKRPPEWVADVLAARNRAAAGKTVPPEGLYLVGVRFDLPQPHRPPPDSLAVPDS